MTILYNEVPKTYEEELETIVMDKYKIILTEKKKQKRR